MLADLVRKCQQININFHSASILSTKFVHITRQQIGTKGQIKPADRI